jgi:hypothetical protein
MTRYQAGEGVIDVVTSDETTRQFACSFLDPSPAQDDGPPLATITVTLDVVGAPAATHGTVAVAATGDQLLVGRRSPDVALDRGELLGVLRKVVREVWLARSAPDGDYFYLHASAVDDGDRVVVFTGDKRAGKTTMMLDAVAYHGHRLLTNDGLLFVRSGADLVLAPLPTLAKIRGDVVSRYLPYLTGRPLDPFNAAQLDAWHDGTLFLTFGALGRRFAAVPMAKRHVVIAGVRFDPPPRLVGLAGPDAVALVDRNRKALPVFFGDLVGFTPSVPEVERGLVADIVAQTTVLECHHDGEVAALLESLP